MCGELVWTCNPNVLASPGVCITNALLPVLRHVCFKDSPDCHHTPEPGAQDVFCA